MSDFQPQKPWTLFTTIWFFGIKPRISFQSAAQGSTLASPVAFVVYLLLACTALRAVFHFISGSPSSSLTWLTRLPMETMWVCLATIGLHFSLRAVKRGPVPLALSLRLMAYSLGPWIVSPLWPILPGIAGEIAVLLILLFIMGILFAGLRSACGLTPPLAAAVIMINLVLVMIAAALFQQISLIG